MSKVSRSRWPDCSATQIAPVTPPAGPDSSMVTGAPIAASATARPPSLRRMDSGARTPSAASWSLRLATYLATCGCT